MSIEQNKAAVRQFCQFFNENRIEEMCAALVRPDMVAHQAGQPEPLNLEEFYQLGLMYRRAFPECRIDVESQVGEGDLVVTRTLFRGVHRGELQGILPTGREVAVYGVVVTRHEDGQIVERWEFDDILGLLNQLGVLSPEAM